MDLSDAVVAVARLWGLDIGDWSVIVAGQTATVRLRTVGVVVHVTWPGVGGLRVSALQLARAGLDQSDIPVVELVPSLAGNLWEVVGGRVVEVERWVEHDGRMNTWGRLRAGAALLARVHDAWATLSLGADAEVCDWANWIAPADVVDGCEHAARRLFGWGLRGLAADVVRLAELTADDFGLPVQIVHGDFWDNNVYVRRERLVAVTDFDFLGRRPRIDDLALLLYFSDEQPYFDGSGPRNAEVRRVELSSLVRAYTDTLTVPMTVAEAAALPYALARQPLWRYGKWIRADTDDDHARREALCTAPAVSRALEVMAEPERWAEAFSRSDE